MDLRTESRVRRSHLFWHIVFFTLSLSLLYIVVRGIGPVLTPIVAALFLSYLLDPAVSFLERRLRFPRWAGTLVLFFVVVLGFVLLFLLVIPLVVREIHTFADAVPGYASKIRAFLIPWIQRTFSVQVPSTLEDLVVKFGAELRGLAQTSLSSLGGMAGWMAKGAGSVLQAVGTILLMVVFTFYFLPKFPAILESAEDLIPRRYLAWIRETASEVNRALAAWIRGQLMVIGVLSVLYSAGLAIAGVKMAVVIGALTGCLAFIPYVGVVLGLSLALLVSLFDYSSLGQLVGVVAVFGGVQVLDGLIVTPTLVGEKVGLGTVGVIIALMLGGNLFGFTGVLLAVPTAAALVVVLRRTFTAYRASAFYKREAAGGLAGADPAGVPEPGAGGGARSAGEPDTGPAGTVPPSAAS
jgi:predicted PurR-regulated permease PerM